MNMHFYSLKIDDDELFKNMLKIPVSILIPLKSMLNFEVDRLYLQQLEYEMDCTDYPVDYNFFEIGYFGHLNVPYANGQFNQATNLMLSHLQEEDHPLIHDTLKNKITQMVSLYIFLQT